MVGPAVEFEDEPAVGPGEVDLEARDEGVDPRRRQPLPADQRQESLLERAPGEWDGGIPGGEDRAEGRCTGTPRVTLHQQRDGGEIEPPGELSPVERRLELPAPDHPGEVEQGAADARDRDPLVDGHLVRVEPRAMAGEGGFSAELRGGSDLGSHGSSVAGRQS
ncbi:MAG TPA: hypothetical protein VKA89_12085 [Solirubrobacterales bacterium]|nr:hypothetical protein [Solirubrobacterales bacterium]